MPSGFPGHRGHVVVDGVADVADELALRQGRDAMPHGRLGDVREPLVFRIGRSHDHGPGRVRVPPVHNCTAVDGEDVAVLENPVAGDAVDHFLVDGRADGGREAVVAQEVGRGTGLFEDCGENGVQFAGGFAGDGRGHRRIQGAAEDVSGLDHGAHLGVGLVFDAGLAECHQQRSFQYSRPSVPRWAGPVKTAEAPPGGPGGASQCQMQLRLTGLP